jgi:hypothetical protein
MTSDQYSVLRPAQPTPSDKLCQCEDSPPLLLRSVLEPNPVACAKCNLEVPPERLGLSKRLARSLAHWRSFHDCFFLLWLDSAEFEAWACRELSHPQSPVNTRGLALRAELDQLRRSYYFWFQDVEADGFRPLDHCPSCKQGLSDVGLVGLVCERCSVLVAK